MAKSVFRVRNFTLFTTREAKLDSVGREALRGANARHALADLRDLDKLAASGSPQSAKLKYVLWLKTLHLLLACFVPHRHLGKPSSLQFALEAPGNHTKRFVTSSRFGWWRRR